MGSGRECGAGNFVGEESEGGCYSFIMSFPCDNKFGRVYLANLAGKTPQKVKPT